MNNLKEHQKELLEAINYKMPYGKFKGIALLKIPEPYYVWYKNKGFPVGKLGRYMQLMYEIKLNGLETELYPLLEKNKG